MKWVNSDNNIPIKSWCRDIEPGAMEQVANLANLPFAYRHVAIMPDCHQGYGMPIGGVLATRGVIIPNAVGVDIGCGMRAVKTDYPAACVNPAAVKKIIGQAREVIPVGFEHHSEDKEWEEFDFAPDVPIIQQELASARRQLGTLGGGNHFIEIQAGSDGRVWLMIHSGSRNFGLKIAKAYHEKAKVLCEKWHSNIPHKDLSFLPLGIPDTCDYISAMKYALDFAQANRSVMMGKFKDIFTSMFTCEFCEDIDVHHNYARMENHSGQNVMVHRKGATSAKKGEFGIIPGSQGTASYIVRGLGNSESFMSCSHGAGRKMGRKQAQRDLDLDEQQRQLDDAGVVHSIRNVSDLDEAPGAYKDIDEVMDAQRDLVEIVVKLKPLGVLKG